MKWEQARKREQVRERTEKPTSAPSGVFTARYRGRCEWCGKTIVPGQRVMFGRISKKLHHIGGC